MIRKTEKIYTVNVHKDTGKEAASYDFFTRSITFKKTAYWFLFIPLYSKKEILSSER